MKSGRLIGVIKKHPFLIVTAVLWLGLTIFIEPGRYAKSTLGKKVIRVDSVIGFNGDNTRSHFEELHENFFITYPGKQEPLEVYLSFHEDASILISGGVVSWTESDDLDRSIIDFEFNIGDQHINQHASQKNPIREILSVDSGDVLLVKINQGTEWYFDEGYFEIKRNHPWLPWVIGLCSLLASIAIALSIIKAPLTFPLVLLSISIFYFDEVTIANDYPNRVSLIWAMCAVVAITILRLREVKSALVGILKNSALATLLLSLIFIPLINVSNYIRFGKGLYEYDYFALFQTNLNEALEYFNQNSSSGVFILVAVVAISIIPFVLEFKTRKIALSKSLSIVLIVLSGLGILIFPTTSSISTATDAFQEYRRELAEFIELQESIDNNEVDLEASTTANGELHVVIIGESHNKHHMSLYGYHRMTTPKLDSLAQRNELIIMDEAIAHHTHTHPVLELALSSASLYNQQRFKNSHTIINLLNAAGYHTTWLSNQVKIGAWDNHVSLIAMGCDEQFFLNKNIGTSNSSGSYDEVIIQKLEAITNEEQAANQVIFIHLMGSHGNYAERWPKDRRIIRNPTKGEFGNFNTWIVDDYDNSIVYNDSVLAEIIKVVDQAPQSIKSLMYFADHSEEVARGDGHSMALFDYEMTEIPMFWWFSKAYKEAYSERIEQLKNNRHRAFTNDLIHDQIAEIASIEGATYSEQYSLFSREYNPSLEHMILVDQRHPYTADTNQYYVERKNDDSLRNGWQKKIGVHRANTLGKLHHASARLSFKQVEIDVVFQSDSNLMFEIGHGEQESMTYMDLRTYLSDPVCKEIDRFWLDLKNLNEQNIDEIKNHLQDSVLQAFKDKLILESSTASPRFKELSDLGFYTSYYIPTSIRDIESETEKREWAGSISKQVKAQNVNAVSFDAALYPWVKQFLEPLLDEKVEYLSWQLDISMSDPNLTENLKSSSVIGDERSKLVLINLRSKFDY